MKGEAQLPAFYTMRALGELAHVSWYMLRKLLRECGVRPVRTGRKALIPTAEIAKKMPRLYQSLKLVASTRRQREEGKWR